MTIPWIAWGTGVKPGRIETPIRTFDTAATTLWLLGVEVPANWAGRPVESAFNRPAAVTAPAP
jgi:arylsulfatase A-like enzyme